MSQENLLGKGLVSVTVKEDEAAGEADGRVAEPELVGEDRWKTMFGLLSLERHPRKRNIVPGNILKERAGWRGRKSGRAHD